MKFIIISAVHLFISSARKCHRSTRCQERRLQAIARSMPTNDFIVTGNDLNGHVGETADGNRCNEGKIFRPHNVGGERTFNFKASHGLICYLRILVYSFIIIIVEKNQMQIDYILRRCHDFLTVAGNTTTLYRTISKSAVDCLRGRLVKTL